MASIQFTQIGILECEQKERYEAPRQGVYADGNKGIIRLNPKCNFEQAVKDLEGFDKIWLIYQFNQNPNWKPLVRPPRYFKGKIGVFATRSPFRPNPIGLSCVNLVKVEKLNIHITDFDLLDQTPILDIKPYLPYSDSFPEAKTGWVEKLEKTFSIIFAELAEEQLNWVFEKYSINLKNYIKVQLQFEPENVFRKRITSLSENIFILSYRTWKIHYEVDKHNNSVYILKISFEQK